MIAPPDPPGRRPAPPRDAAAPSAFRRRAAVSVNAGYSRMVQLMKVALPLGALGILALVAAWPSFTETAAPKLSANPVDSDLLQPRYFAVDEKGQPFSMTAKRAKEKDPQSGLVDLDEPEAEMTETGGSWVTMRARSGEYNRLTKILHLVGDVRILRDDGTEYRTEDAYTDIAAGTAWGDAYIVGQGPQGEVAGQGFRMSDRGKTMVFTNRAAVTTPSGAPSGAPSGGAPSAVADAPRPAPTPLPIPSTPAVSAPIPPVPVPPIHAPAAAEPAAAEPVFTQTPPAQTPPAVLPLPPAVKPPPVKPQIAGPTAAPAAPTGWTPPPPRRKPIPPKRN